MEHEAAQDSSLLSPGLANHPMPSTETTSIHSQYASMDHLLNPLSSATRPAPNADVNAGSNEKIDGGRNSWFKPPAKKARLTYALAGLFIIVTMGLGLGLGFGLGNVKHRGPISSNSSSPNGPANIYNETFATSKSYYPSPKGGWSPLWEDSYKKAAKLVSQMSLLEKVNITTGTGWSMVSLFSILERSSKSMKTNLTTRGLVLEIQVKPAWVFLHYVYKTVLWESDLQTI